MTDRQKAIHDYVLYGDDLKKEWADKYRIISLTHKEMDKTILWPMRIKDHVNCCDFYNYKPFQRSLTYTLIQENIGECFENSCLKWQCDCGEVFSFRMKPHLIPPDHSCDFTKGNNEYRKPDIT